MRTDARRYDHARRTRRWSPLVISLVVFSSANSSAETGVPVAEWESNDPAQSAESAEVESASDWQPPVQRRPSPGPRPEPEQLLERRWYGWQILLADLATVGVTAASQSEDVFLASYFALPYLVHTANLEIGRSLGSVGLRLVLPFLFSRALDTGPGYDGETSAGYVWGLLTGGLVASVLDVSVLGWKLAPPEPPSAPKAERKRRPERKPWIEPRIQPLPRGLSAGIVGGF